MDYNRGNKLVEILRELQASTSNIIVYSRIVTEFCRPHNEICSDKRLHGINLVPMSHVYRTTLEYITNEIQTLLNIPVKVPLTAPRLFGTGDLELMEDTVRALSTLRRCRAVPNHIPWSPWSPWSRPTPPRTLCNPCPAICSPDHIYTTMDCRGSTEILVDLAFLCHAPFYPDGLGHIGETVYIPNKKTLQFPDERVTYFLAGAHKDRKTGKHKLQRRTFDLGTEGLFGALEKSMANVRAILERLYDTIDHSKAFLEMILPLVRFSHLEGLIETDGDQYKEAAAIIQREVTAKVVVPVVPDVPFVAPEVAQAVGSLYTKVCAWDYTGKQHCTNPPALAGEVVVCKACKRLVAKDQLLGKASKCKQHDPHAPSAYCDGCKKTFYGTGTHRCPASDHSEERSIVSP